MAKETREMGMSKEMACRERRARTVVAGISICKRMKSRTRSFTTIGLRTGRLPRWSEQPLAVPVPELSSRSAGKTAHPIPLRAPAASSCHQIAGFCLPQTAGTIRFPASLWATRAGSP